MILAVLLPAFLSVMNNSAGSVTIDRVEYHGWPGCYRMSNTTAELVYVPQIGRIMRFAKPGESNMLWENSKLAGKTANSAKVGEWANYGGDKLWPAPQSLWNWPPDPILDGAPYEVAIEGNSLVISGASSPKSGVRFSRRITMDSTGGAVRIQNKMTNTSDKPQELALWEICQTDNPDRVIVPLEKTPEMPLGWAPYDAKPIDPAFASVLDGVLVVYRDPKAGFKLGSASSKGVLTAERGGVQFQITLRKAAGKYVDGGKFLEVYGNGDPDKYMELEVTGPLTTMPPGDSIELDVTWRLQKVASR